MLTNNISTAPPQHPANVASANNDQLCRNGVILLLLYCAVLLAARVATARLCTRICPAGVCASSVQLADNEAHRLGRKGRH
jgi:hypothetical protein